VRLAYLGTPEVAVPPLRALVESGHEVVLVVSGPDRRRGRGAAASPSPVKAAALQLELPVADDPDALLGVRADLGVVVAYGRLIRPHLLAHLPMVNLHFSLLPRWRGAAPVERAILAGDRRSGVCVMDVEEELDTGGVRARAEIPIGPDTTADELRAQLVGLGTDLLLATLANGLGDPQPQASDGVTYAAKLTVADRRLDWNQPAEMVHRVVRIGGAWTTLRGRRLLVLEADRGGPVDAPPGALVERDDGVLVACGDRAAIRLLRVRPEGARAMSADEFVRGRRPAPDERLDT
jgi:methionyl-tRNA formyltransferase